MKKNMGLFDRILRIIVAAIIAYLYFTKELTGTLGIILLVAAAIFLITGVFGVCLLYKPFKLKSFRGKE